jgi:hypothetical protein
MSSTETKQWAREMILRALDTELFNDDSFVMYSLDFDDREALLKERNRVAKLFKLPSKK